MEPFRPIVDREILRLVLNDALNAGDFTITREGFCRLNPQLARKVVAEATATLSGFHGL
jgi:CRISPR-associated protein Cas1